MKKFRFYVMLILVVCCVAIVARSYTNNQTIDIKQYATLFQTTQSSETLSAIDLDKVKVKSVVDGDTLWVIDSEDNSFKVRMIGVNTPESVSSDESKNCEQGKIASNYTKSKLTVGETVYLEYGENKEDDYGRTLAYVWLKDVDNDSNENAKKYMYNTELLEKGYAQTMFINPNYKYQTLFETIEKEASDNNTGFWSDREELDW